MPDRAAIQIMRRARGSRTMRMLAAIRLAVVLLVATAIAGSAFGQGHGRAPTASQVPHYTPQSPTVSPYLNLLNRNGGPASNYYGLVRPLQRQQSFNEAQSQATSYQEQQLGSQAQQIGHLRDEQQAFSQPKVKATGTSGWFQNMGQTPPYQVSSHYYGQWQGTKKAQRHGGASARVSR